MSGATTDIRVLRATFALFDKNESKRISVNDMSSFLNLMGEEANEKEILEMLQEVSGSDGLDFDSFAKFMMQPDEDSESLSKHSRSSSTESNPKKKSKKSIKSPVTTQSGSAKKRIKKTTIPKTKIVSLDQSIQKRSRSTSSRLLSFLKVKGKSSPKKIDPIVKNTNMSSITRKRSKSNSEVSSYSSRIIDMQRAFQAFDVNNDGKLSTREVNMMMRKFGLDSQEQSIQNLFDLLPGEKTEEIDFDQFMNLTSLV
jgi:Ca2+-binding EF-hand superfamily protein